MARSLSAMRCAVMLITGLFLLLPLPLRAQPEATAATLIRQLRTGKDTERVSAAEELGEYDDDAAITALLDALKYAKPPVRAAAALALGQNADPRALEPLLAAIRKEDFAVRLATSRALAGFDTTDPRVNDTLAGLLSNPSPPLRKAALDGLGWRQDPRLPNAARAVIRDRDATVRRAGYAWLLTQGKAVPIDIFRTALTDPDAMNRALGVLVISSRQDPEMIPLLCRMARDRDKGVRNQVFTILLKHPCPEVSECMLQVLQDKDKDIRSMAHRLLCLHKDRRVIPAFIALIEKKVKAEAGGRRMSDIEDDDLNFIMKSYPQEFFPETAELLAARQKRLTGRARILMLGPLLFFQRSKSFEFLFALANNPDAVIREKIAESLPQISDPRATDCLLTLLHDRDRRVRQAVAFAVARMKVAPENPLHQAAVPLLLELLADPNVYTRIEAVKALAAIDATAAAPRLIKALSDKDPAVRGAAALALGDLRCQEAYEPLLELLKRDDLEKLKEHGDAVVAWGDDVITALCHLDDTRAVRPLLTKYAARIADGNLRLIGPLRAMGSAAIREMSAMYRESTDATLRLAIVMVVRESNDPAALEILLATARPGEAAALRKAALPYLGQYRDPRIVPILIDALHDADPDLRQGAISMLYSYSEPRATDALLALFDESTGKVRLSIINILPRTVDRPFAQRLVSLLTDPDPELRQAALRKLQADKELLPLGTLVNCLTDADAGVRNMALQAIPFRAPTANDADADRIFHALELTLNDPDEGIRRHAAEILSRIGDVRAVPLLMTAYERERQPGVRNYIASVLKSFTDDRTAVLFRKMASSSSAYRQDIAYEALIALGNPLAIPFVFDSYYYTDQTIDVREELVSLINGRAPRGIAAERDTLLTWAREGDEAALQRFADPRSIDMLLAALEGDDSDDQWFPSVVVLGRLKTPRAVQPLLDQLEWGERHSDSTLLEALGRIGDPRAVPSFLDRLPVYDSRSSDFVYAIGDLRDPQLIARLREIADRNDASPACLAAAAMLVRNGNPEALQIILNAWNSPVVETQHIALESLGATGDSRALEPLSAGLTRDLWIRSSALSGLTTLLSTAASDTLCQQVFQVLQPEIMRPDCSRNILFAALRPLVNKKDPRVIPVLQDIALQHEPLAGADFAVEKLAQFGTPEALAALRKAMTSRNIAVREAAAGWLGFAADRQAEPLLIAAARTDTTRVRLRAIEALGRMKSTAAIDPLVAILADPGAGPRLRLATAGALANITGQDFGDDPARWQRWLKDH